MSRPYNDVVTSSLLSPLSATSRRHSSMSRRPLQPPMSRRQHDVATSTPTYCYSARSRRPFSCRDLPCCYPRRDVKMMSRHQAQLAISCRNSARSRRPFSWSRPHVQPHQVATSQRCRGLKQVLCTSFFFFFSSSSLLFLLLH